VAQCGPIEAPLQRQLLTLSRHLGEALSTQADVNASSGRWRFLPPQEGAECKNINYDPLVMNDGIAPTDDPVLLFRSPSYAVSFVKRLQGQ
jgi:hypothetical protein